VMTAGVPVPVPKKNVKAVKGGGIGGAVGALAGTLLFANPLGIAVLAGIGAFSGAAMGARSDAQEQGS
jgi:hypothetical protein